MRWPTPSQPYTTIDVHIAPPHNRIHPGLRGGLCNPFTRTKVSLSIIKVGKSFGIICDKRWRGETRNVVRHLLDTCLRTLQEVSGAQPTTGIGTSSSTELSFFPEITTPKDRNSSTHIITKSTSGVTELPQVAPAGWPLVKANTSGNSKQSLASTITDIEMLYASYNPSDDKFMNADPFWDARASLRSTQKVDSACACMLGAWHPTFRPTVCCAVPALLNMRM